MLGFRAVMTMPDGDYAVVERDNIAIHLFLASKANAPGSIHIFADGLEDLYNELHRRGAHIHQPIMQKPWGNLDFRVVDDYGTMLKFTEPLPED